MKNLKIGYLALLTLMVFSCTTQADRVDISPELESPTSSMAGDDDKGDIGGPEMTISIYFPSTVDRNAIVQAIGSTIGLTKRTQCPSNPDMEVWLIAEMDFEELEQVLAAFDIDVRRPGNTNAKDPYARDIYQGEIVVYYRFGCFL